MQDAKAKRATIELGDRELEVFQLGDGSYQLSQTQVAKAVNKPRRNASDFLQSKWLKSLPGMDYTGPKKDLVEVEADHEGRGGTRISPISLELAGIYWYYQAKRGNKDAEVLVIGCLIDSLLRRADQAFGVVRTEAEYNQRLKTLETQLSILGDNYAIDDAARDSEKTAWDEVKRLRDWIEDQGLDYPTEE